ncbi:MAG TPA: AI-2E family transporter [Actinomycetota bacterium]|nr:AI-2E family transporter [Actinomycetota bacterium]
MSSSLPTDQPPASERIRRAGAVSWALLGIILLVMLAATALWFVRQILPPLVLALMLIFLLNPLVSALQRRGVSRSLGTAGIYLVFIGAIVIASIYVFPLLRQQFEDLNDRLPTLQQSALNFADRIAGLAGQDINEEQFHNIMKNAQERLLSSVGEIMTFTTGVAHVILTFVLAPIFALYLLIDLPKLQKSFLSYMPPHYHKEWLFLLQRCGQAVGGFFRGQLVVAGIVGIMSAIAFALLDLPFWLPLGLLAGFFNIIPLVGPFIGGTIAAVVGGVTFGPSKALWVALAMLAVQQIDNHFISPNVMSRTVRLHPVTVMLALLAGGTLAGLWGMLLAVPGMAIAKIIGFHYYETRVLGRLPSGPDGARENDDDEGIVKNVGDSPETQGAGDGNDLVPPNPPPGEQGGALPNGPGGALPESTGEKSG